VISSPDGQTHLYTLPEALEAINMTKSCYYHRRWRGADLPKTVKLGNKVYVTAEELNAFMAAISPHCLITSGYHRGREGVGDPAWHIFSRHTNLQN